MLRDICEKWVYQKPGQRWSFDRSYTWEMTKKRNICNKNGQKRYLRSKYYGTIFAGSRVSTENYHIT